MLLVSTVLFFGSNTQRRENIVFVTLTKFLQMLVYTECVGDKFVKSLY